LKFPLTLQSIEDGKTEGDNGGWGMLNVLDMHLDDDRRTGIMQEMT